MSAGQFARGAFVKETVTTGAPSAPVPSTIPPRPLCVNAHGDVVRRITPARLPAESEETLLSGYPTPAEVPAVPIAEDSMRGGAAAVPA